MMIAVVSSPVFSPQKIFLPRKASSGKLLLSLAQQHLSSEVGEGSPSMASTYSPFRRIQRGDDNLRILKKGQSISESLDLNSASTSFCRTSTSSCSCSSPVSASSLFSSASVSKKKRPARLDIPMLGSMALDPPMKSDGRRELAAESTRYSVFCKRGRKRLEMEDRYSAAVDLGGDSQMALFGIFDGHGGSKASQFTSENLGVRILEETLTGRSEEEAVKNGYLRTDAEFLKENVSGGTCCVTAFVMNGDLIVSNAGDCRAVISISGAAKPLTSDHRPSRSDEKSRIEKLGGYVDCSRGVCRLQGSLAVSRGIGDSHLKQWVIPDPETRVIKIDPQCEFLILASDGLWEKVSNQEAVDIARPMCVDPQRASPLSACKKLVNLSISRGSMDDISVLIIQLGHYLKQV